MDYKFSQFQRVVVRHEGFAWCADLFSHKAENGVFICVGGRWEECLPWIQGITDVLVGTRNDAPEVFSTFSNVQTNKKGKR